MAYRLWCGVAATPEEYAARKPLWRVVIRDTRDEVLWRAKQANDTGQETGWEIEGDDGTRLNRFQIAEALRRKTPEPPKKY